MKILALIGYNGVGKDYVADKICDHLVESRIVYKRKAMALLLKQYLIEAFKYEINFLEKEKIYDVSNIPQPKLRPNDRIFTNESLKRLYSNIKLKETITPREILSLATKDRVTELNLLMINIQDIMNSEETVCLITDLRTQDEYDYFKDMGATFVRVIGDYDENKVKDRFEVLTDSFLVDMVLFNSKERGKVEGLNHLLNFICE